MPRRRSRDDDLPLDYTHANLAESAQYDSHGDGDARDMPKAGEPFPAMVAAALWQIVTEKLL
jgi:hypothetical protein